jgi:hypothetical protein
MLRAEVSGSHFPRGNAMLSLLMLTFAVAAVGLVAKAAFGELRNIWSHPDRREVFRNAAHLHETRPK